ncbi:MAG TPA: phosphate signaling complex protein PhoU [Anaerolineales bacterium]
MTEMRLTFAKELQSIRDDILRMGALLDRSLSLSMQSLAELDEVKAQQVVAEDAAINQLRFGIEAACLAVIARQQPAAGDLRQIVAAMNMVLDLERIGDYAAGIAKTTIRLKTQPSAEALPEGLALMAETSRTMIKRVLQAYAEEDPGAAKHIAAQDEEIDRRYEQLFSSLLEQMAEQPSNSERLLYLLFAGHNLERVADRVTNLAERVVFMTSGKMTELNPERIEPGGLE